MNGKEFQPEGQFTILDGDYIFALWQFAGPADPSGQKWDMMSWAIKPKAMKGKWVVMFRIRLHADDKVFDSADKKLYRFWQLPSFATEDQIKTFVQKTLKETQFPVTFIQEVFVRSNKTIDMAKALEGKKGFHVATGPMPDKPENN